MTMPSQLQTAREALVAKARARSLELRGLETHDAERTLRLSGSTQLLLERLANEVAEIDAALAVSPLRGEGEEPEVVKRAREKLEVYPDDISIRFNPGAFAARQQLRNVIIAYEEGRRAQIYDFTGAYMSDPGCFMELDHDGQVRLARAIAENVGMVLSARRAEAPKSAENDVISPETVATQGFDSGAQQSEVAGLVARIEALALSDERLARGYQAQGNAIHAEAAKARAADLRAISALTRTTPSVEPVLGEVVKVLQQIRDRAFSEDGRSTEDCVAEVHDLAVAVLARLHPTEESE